MTASLGWLGTGRMGPRCQHHKDHRLKATSDLQATTSRSAPPTGCHRLL